jgi:hypothetical protein
MPVYCHSCVRKLNQITGSRDDRFKQWRAAIAARTRITIAAREGKTGERLSRTEFNKVGVGFRAGHIETNRQ